MNDFGVMLIFPSVLLLGGAAAAAYAVWGSRNRDEHYRAYRLRLILATLVAPVLASLVYLWFCAAAYSAWHERNAPFVTASHASAATPFFWLAGLFAAVAALPAYLQPRKVVRRRAALLVAAPVVALLSLGFSDALGMHDDPAVLTLTLVGVAMLLGPIVMLAATSWRSTPE